MKAKTYWKRTCETLAASNWNGDVVALAKEADAEIAELQRERDEARASVAALREAARLFRGAAAEAVVTDSGGPLKEVFRTADNYREASANLDAALNQPTPGAALLERLRRGGCGGESGDSPASIRFVQKIRRQHRSPTGPSQLPSQNR